MQVDNRYDETAFNDLDWYDCRVYRLDIPDENNQFKLDIDFIFKWEKNEGEVSGVWVSPCDLIFKSVNNLKIDIDFDNSMFLFIKEITRRNKRLSKNGVAVLWDYRVDFDNGVISFTSSGYEQITKVQPVFSDSQDLNR